MNKILLYILVASPLFSNAQQGAVPPFLEGAWQRTKNGETITETWKKVNDTLWQASSYLQNGQEKYLQETIDLVKRQGTWTYQAKVEKQNMGQVIPFRATRFSDSDLLFENPEHDFPSAIAYKLVNPDSLVATISGYWQGRMKYISFPMSKVKTKKEGSK